MAGRKIFVGSLPMGIQDDVLRAEMSKYGQVEDIYIKQGCEAGRQWAFVTFASPEQAQFAKDSCDRILTLPGSERPCDVMLAKNQGMFGQQTEAGAAVQVPQVVVPGMAPVPMAASAAGAPRKIFVGSLPDGIDDMTLRATFAPYGQVTDVFVKQGCEPGRQWGFVTFVSSEQAQFAKSSCDRVLVFPGHDRACEVTIAKNQGMFGQDSLTGAAPQQQQQQMQLQSVYGQVVPAVAEGPRKIFVGSLPETITDVALRAEFSKYGQITDVFMKDNCEPGRRWAFVTFSMPEQAQLAKNSTDRVLMFPGAEKACEVMLAKNQGKFGQGATGGAAEAQPPPPTSAPPAHLTPWRMYKTAAGLPYYHNSVTGVTTWDCPPELQAGGGALQMQQQVQAGVRYSPY